MPDRKSLVFTLWITSSLALLASVLVSPVRTSGIAPVSARPDGLRDHFSLPSGQFTTLVSAAPASDDALQVSALPSENEEQSEKVEQAENEEQDWADALDAPRISFLIPCSFHKVPDRQLIAPRSILSLYPLRC